MSNRYDVLAMEQDIMKLIQQRSVRRGFTILELMIVVALIGIVALIVVPKFAGLTGK